MQRTRCLYGNLHFATMKKKKRKNKGLGPAMRSSSPLPTSVKVGHCLTLPLFLHLVQLSASSQEACWTHHLWHFLLFHDQANDSHPLRLYLLPHRHFTGLENNTDCLDVHHNLVVTWNVTHPSIAVERSGSIITEDNVHSSTVWR
jgi:hypothetical protein